MSASDAHPANLKQGGFSLVELLVALALTGFLMAGMLRIFTASVSNFATAHETLGIQRNARWGLIQMQDELMQAGYFMPPGRGAVLVGSGQEPIQILTSATALKYKDTDGNDVTLPATDELELVMDLPLGIEGTLAAAPAQNASTLSVVIPSGGGSLKAEDVAFVQDTGPWEMFVITGTPSASGTTYSLSLKSSLADKLGNDTATAAASPNVGNPHFAGAPVAFFRPLQVIRYSVKALALDPGNNAATVPCLVRESHPLTDPTWSSPEVIVEGVTGLSFDWSLDGGKSWVRAANSLGTSSNWGSIKSKTNDAFLALTNPFTQQLPQGLYSTSDPLWFNYVPVLIRMDLETRTRIQRAEYNPASTASSPSAAYRTRRQTLLIAPRNFTLGGI